MSMTSLVLLSSLVAAPRDNETASTDQVRSAVERGVGFLEEKGAWWIEEKKCVSCHRVGMMVWSLQAARNRGVSVNHRLDEWSRWAVQSTLATNDAGSPVGSGNLEGVAQVLMSRRLPDDDAAHGTSGQLARLIVAGQRADGSWQPGGQLPSQKRDPAETAEVTTMWLAVALAQLNTSQQYDENIARAMSSLERSEHQSTEWYAVRLLLASQFGRDDTSQRLIAELRRQQNADGGWGWLVGADSDALGTGMSMYALLKAGIDRADSMMQRAQSYLVDTQRNDGSWPVRGTKANKQDQIQETAVYWGTTWGLLALTESLNN